MNEKIERALEFTVIAGVLAGTFFSLWRGNLESLHGALIIIVCVAGFEGIDIVREVVKKAARG